MILVLFMMVCTKQHFDCFLLMDDYIDEARMIEALYLAAGVWLVVVVVRSAE